MAVPVAPVSLVTAPRLALAMLADQPDDAVPLAQAALWLAALDHPGKGLDAYTDHLQALVDALRDRLQASPAETAADRASALSAVLATDWGYQGDVETYEDLQNADLMRVIDRRRGLPVALGILYLHVARAQGWDAHGLNFPGHFLIRLDGEAGDRAIIDPFHGGPALSVADLRSLLKAMTGQAAELTPDMYAPLSNRAVLIRLQSNIKMRLLDGGMLDAAGEILQRMLLFAPQDYRLWRENGLLYMRRGNLESALDALETYLTLAPDGDDRTRIAQVMAELRQRLQ